MRFAPALLMVLLAAPAMAQEIQEPRYEALEQQLQTLDQRRLDGLEKQRLNEQFRSFTDPNVTAAQSALRQLEINRQRDLVVSQMQQDRAAVERQRIIAESALPNRRIAPSSILVVSQPELYGLPRLPANKYYARLEGRFVVVDRASELVDRVLPVQPTDPTADVPLGPRPMPLPPIPVADMLANDLPTPAFGQYYSRQGGNFVLVDERTAKVLRTAPAKRN